MTAPDVDSRFVLIIPRNMKFALADDKERNDLEKNFVQRNKSNLSTRLCHVLGRCSSPRVQMHFIFETTSNTTNTLYFLFEKKKFLTPAGIAFKQ